MGLQLLQNAKIIKQTDILIWKIWRKYGSVSYLFSCTSSCPPSPSRFSHLSTALHHWSFRKPSQWKISILFPFTSFQSLENRTKFEWCICVLLIHVANFMYNTWKKFAFSSFNFLFLSTDSFWQIMGICYHCLLSSETMSHLCPRRLIHRVDELHISNSFFCYRNNIWVKKMNTICLITKQV